MIIDWFTVVAQIVNFLVLIWLLKRFLYKPIIKAMDRREKSIAERLAAADRELSQAEEKQQKYVARLLQFEEEKKERVKLVEEETRHYRDELLAEAGLAAEKSRNAWQRNITEERRDFLKQLRKKIGAEIIRLLRIALRDLADEELITSIARVFTGRLYALDEETRATLATQAQEAEIEVVSSCELKDTERDELTTALQATCGDNRKLVFTTNFEMEPGVLVNIGGLRLAWGLEEYLDSLEQNISDMISRIVPNRERE